MRNASTAILSLINDLSVITGIGRRTFLPPTYDYMFSPQQLIFLTECLTDTKDVAGCYVEAGCAFGGTTGFLKKFMEHANIRKAYIALDTFSGFTAEHLDYEVSARGKNQNMQSTFAYNKKRWFDTRLASAGIRDVRSIQTDVTKFDFSSIAPIAFCLIDVDLYLPVRDILPKVFNALSPGGLIVVDDCKPNTEFDGAHQAYTEFLAGKAIAPRLILDKLGVIKKG